MDEMSARICRGVPQSPSTYKDHNMVDDQQNPGNSGELERKAPLCVIIFTVLDVVVDEHAPGCKEIGQETTAYVTQSVLVEGSPGGMGSPKENGLYMCQRIIIHVGAQITLRTYVVRYRGLALLVVLATAANERRAL